MKKFLLTLGLAMATANVASAASACSTFVGQSVLNINVAGGCSLGNLLFNDFQVINNGGFTTTNVNVGAATGQTGYDSNFAFAVNTSPPVAPITGGDIILQYTVTGANQVGASIFLGTASNVAITEEICSQPFSGPGNTTCLGMSVSQNVSKPVPPGTATASLLFDTPRSVAYVQKDIAFGNNGSISDFINVHSAIPEPTTSLLMGSALLGLALLRKRFTGAK